MFQRLRRKRGPYWYFSDKKDSDRNGDKASSPSSLSSKNSQGGHVDGGTSSSCKIVEMTEDATAPTSTTATTNGLEIAMAVQSHFTSWPGSIWEKNFEETEGEIVFAIQDDDNECNTDPCDDSASKSVGTMETEDETMPSSYSSPERQNMWELDDLDLSVIEQESSDEEEGAPLAKSKESLVTADLDDYKRKECALFACSADLHNKLLKADINRQPLHESGSSMATSSPGASNYFLIEESFDPFAISSDTSLEESSFCSLDPKHRQKKSVRFADEEGTSLCTVYVVDHDEGFDPSLQRVLILMLLPRERKFEFVHVEFSTTSRISVSSLLRQLPDLATDPMIANQQYSRLCRAAGGSELINALSIQDYGLDSDEILVAVLNGYSGKDMYKMAQSVVKDEKILRAVKRTQKKEHTLHRVKSNEELNDVCTSKPNVCTSKPSDSRTLHARAHHRAEANQLFSWCSQTPTSTQFCLTSLNLSFKKRETKPKYRKCERTQSIESLDDRMKINDMRRDNTASSNQEIGRSKFSQQSCNIGTPKDFRPNEGHSEQSRDCHNQSKRRRFGFGLIRRKSSTIADSRTPERFKQIKTSEGSLVPLKQCQGANNWASRFVNKRWNKLRSVGARSKIQGIERRHVQ